MVMPQTPLIEVAPARGVRVLGGFEDVAMWALAVRVGVRLRLAVSVDRKKVKPRGCEKPKDVGREERWLGGPLAEAVQAQCAKQPALFVHEQREIWG